MAKRRRCRLSAQRVFERKTNETKATVVSRATCSPKTDAEVCKDASKSQTFTGCKVRTGKEQIFEETVAAEALARRLQLAWHKKRVWKALSAFVEAAGAVRIQRAGQAMLLRTQARKGGEVVDNKLRALRRIISGLVIAAAVRRWYLRRAALQAALREEPQWLRDAGVELLRSLDTARAMTETEAGHGTEDTGAERGLQEGAACCTPPPGSKTRHLEGEVSPVTLASGRIEPNRSPIFWFNSTRMLRPSGSGTGGRQMRGKRRQKQRQRATDGEPGFFQAHVEAALDESRAIAASITSEEARQRRMFMLEAVEARQLEIALQESEREGGESLAQFRQEVREAAGPVGHHSTRQQVRVQEAARRAYGWRLRGNGLHKPRLSLAER